ncbi:MAG: HupE/UreJ family protein [Vicinamibacterales bacterium]
MSGRALRPASWLVLVLCTAAAWTVLLVPTGAHEVPNEVTVHAFVKPQGDHLTLLVRAPLNAMRDMDVPTREGGYLDLSRIDRVATDAAILWIGDYVEMYEDGRQLGKPTVVSARVSLPSDQSFRQYETAEAHLYGPPLDPSTDLYWEQGLLDVEFRYPITSDQARFAIEPGLTRLGLSVNVALTFITPDGTERVFDIHGEHGVVTLDPAWYQAAWRFVEDGFFHILDGTDHLLFLLCLVIPFRRIRPLLAVVTSFTIAHSVTLVASAYDLAPNALWFPPLIETLIAVSIVYMAFENIVGAKIQRRWMITFGFGLVHGFGFSFALRETLQFAGSHVLTSLLAFNVGVELGQIAVLIVLVPALDFLFRRVVDERMGTILISALVAHTAWHWAQDRYGVLSQFEWPAFDPAGVAAFLRLLMLVVVAAALVWGVVSLLQRPGRLPGFGPSSEVRD